MLARARARSGSDDAASSSPASRRYWGGRLAQALERDPAVEAIIGVAPEDPTLRARAHGVRPRRHPARAAAADRPAPREIDTVVDTRLIVDSRHGARRASRTRHNVIGTMNILAACGGPDSPVRKVVFKSSAHYYGCERDDPAFFTEDDAAPAPAAHAARARHRRGRRRPSQGFAERNPDVTVTDAALLQRARARTCGPAHSALLALPGRPGDPRLRPALPVHPRGRHRRRARSTRCATTCRASTTPRRTACSRCREVAGLLGKPLAPVLPPWGTGLAAARAAARSGCAIPDEMLPAAALRPRAGQPQAQGGRLPLRATRRARRCRRSPRQLRLRPCARAPGAPYRYEREVEEFLRCARACGDAELPPGLDAPARLQDVVRRAVRFLPSRAPHAYPAHSSSLPVVALVVLAAAGRCYAYDHGKRN